MLSLFQYASTKVCEENMTTPLCNFVTVSHVWNSLAEAVKRAGSHMVQQHKVTSLDIGQAGYTSGQCKYNNNNNNDNKPTQVG